MKRLCSVTAILFLICFTGGQASFPAPALADGLKITQAQKKLEEINKRLKSSYADLESQKARAKALRRDLAFVEKEMGRIEKRLAGLQEKVRSGEEALQRQKNDSRRLKAAIVGTEDQVGRRLCALYKSDQATLVKLFFSSQSPSGLMENVVYFQKIIERDKAILAAYRTDFQALQASLENLKSLQAAQQRLLDKALDARQERKTARDLKRKLLTRASGAEKRLSRDIARLRSRAGQLSSLIRKLEDEKKREYQGKKGEFSRQKGKLSWPVDGRIKIGFGTWKHPELDTLYESQGLEISAPPNHSMRAVWNGNVAFASPFKGYGNLLIINHGEGYYTLYGHASKLMKKAGEAVSQGEVVALSGFDGRDSIFFEIRRRGTPLDPTKWLTAK